MFKILIHGRGGQGAKTMALLLAEATIESGKYAQAYPEFGPERTGAPVKSYLRVAGEPIETREPITKPDLVIVLDDTLMETEEVKETLKENPILLLNTPEESEEVKKYLKDKIGFTGTLHTVDAYGKISQAKNKIHFSAPIFGKLLKIYEFISLGEFEQAYRDKFTQKLGEEVVKETLSLMAQSYDEF
jgi:pyruvate ferredoxin oxidoreductase gamma subunit